MSQKRPVLLLEMVLLPGTEATLRLMDKASQSIARACYEAKTPFGLLYCKEEGEAITGKCAQTGCFAEVLDLKDDKDGAVITQIIGGQRFKVLTLEQQKTGGYEATYTLVHDGDSTFLEGEIFNVLLNLLEIYLETLSLIDEDMVEPLPENLSAVDLTFLVLDYASIGEDVRQQGLEILDIRERAQFCLKLLKQEIARLHFLMEGFSEEDEADFDQPPSLGRLH